LELGSIKVEQSPVSHSLGLRCDQKEGRQLVDTMSNILALGSRLEQHCEVGRRDGRKQLRHVVPNM
jgi:hypothetical protein